MRIVRDKNSRSRGYAFIVFERERDMKGEGDICSRQFLHPHRTAVAYKESDRLVIMGKRVLVDVERGRTVRGWKPRRLGGGLGGRPKPEPLPLSGRGGFRGPDRGDRGGFRGRGGGGAYSGRGGGFRGGGGGFRGGRDDFGGGGRGGGYGGGGFRCVLRSPVPTETNYISSGGRGGGIGYQGGGGFSEYASGGPGGPPNGSGGYGPPGSGYGGGYGGGGGGFGPPRGGGGYGGGYRPDLKREGPGMDEDRDSKRPRY